MNQYHNAMIQKDLEELSQKLDYTKLNHKTILITGSTGMLASYMVYFLIFLNENIKDFSCKIIIPIRNLEKAKLKYGEYLEKDYIQVYQKSLEETIELEQKVDYMVHAASIAQTQLFQTNPIDVIVPNTIMLKNLLDLAEKNKVEGFLFFSTCSIYGKVENYNEIKENIYGILNPLDENSCYSESKRLGETLCKAYFMQKKVKIKIARISHTYGPTIDLNSDNRVFAEFVKNILNQEDIILKSDGKAVRSFLYILDATEAFFKILLDGKYGEAYNVANPYENVSIRDLANRLVQKFQERNIHLKFQNREDNYIENKYDNNKVYSIQKAIEELDWNPSISIEEGFERTVKSFEEEKNEEN